MGIRPTSMIFHHQPTDPWIDMDFLLLEAFETLESEKCGHCGKPVWICRSSESVYFEVREDTCFADKALADYQHRKQQRNAKRKGVNRNDFGKHPYVVAYTFDENAERDYDHLPSRRDFFNSQGQE